MYIDIERNNSSIRYVNFRWQFNGLIMTNSHDDDIKKVAYNLF